MTLSSGTRLGAYEILSPLGSGGMGEVYRARDAKLEREVAIKVLPAHLTSSADALSRFEREAKAVAALSHPNILAIYDFGTQDGVSYAVTELLEGETLRGKMDGAPVSQKQAIDWALQIAKGLSAAHGKGVVHRDLKPENVFVSSDGHVKILDFGLAKRVDTRPEEQTSAPTGAPGTEPGTVMGTMGYMSPEQVRGLPVDARTDIFSFGAMLYESLSGKRAFKRDTASDTIAAILKEEPPELTQSGRNVSPALDHIVRHCLEKDRENRFQTAKDVAFALSEASSPTTAATSGSFIATPAPAPPKRSAIGLVAVAGAIVLAAAGYFVWKGSKGSHAAAPTGVRRVVVLPFENLGAPEDDYFADGIADAIRGKLTAVPGVEVVARGSSNAYRKSTKTPQEIAAELSANYLLTATVRWQKNGAVNRVQVSPELVEIKPGAPPASKWQQPFDAALTDVFQVQSDIASRVVQSLGVALAEGQEKKLAKSPTTNVAAYDAYLKGEQISGSMGRADAAALRKALGFYEQAAALDPTFSDAWARVATASGLLYANGRPDPELAKASLEAAQKSIALGPENAEAYRALGSYYRMVLGDSERGLVEYRKAERMAPGAAEPPRSIGRALVQLGRAQESIASFERAERLDPRNAANVGAVAQPLLALRRCAEARAAIDRRLAIDPSDLLNLEARAETYLCEGNLEGARRALAEAMQVAGPQESVAYFASMGLDWTFDSDQRGMQRALTAEAFDGDTAAWAAAQTSARYWSGDPAGVREYAERQRAAAEEQLRGSPDNASSHASLAAAFAALGRKEDAVREALVSLSLIRRSTNQNLEPGILMNLAWVYAYVGESDKAIDTLETVLAMPCPTTRAWLGIDPFFKKTLGGNPRFAKLVAAST